MAKINVSAPDSALAEATHFWPSLLAACCLFVGCFHVCYMAARAPLRSLLFIWQLGQEVGAAIGRHVLASARPAAARQLWRLLAPVLRNNQPSGPLIFAPLVLGRANIS